MPDVVDGKGGDLAEILDDRLGAIVRAIIGDEDFEILERLIEIAVQHFVQPLRLVVGADDDALFHGTGVGS